MKLRNKKTGAIYKIEDIDLGNNADGIWLGLTKYNSLAELNEEWGDYEEPKKQFNITPPVSEDDNTVLIEFPTHKEAEKAVEKLKALNRLKENNLSIEKTKRTFVNTDDVFTLQTVTFSADTYEEIEHDLDLLFSREEE